ncbi:MAG TPA: hypothetical protein VJQ79_00840, partial [Acidimicrobiia bacterium]|nr:hypothetical protein [Acidimicrobiia bacterium]
MSRGEGRCPLGLLLACIALPSCSDHTDPGGNGSVGLRVVAFPALTDTITATPVQGLVVEVRDENGRLTSGNVVRFAALPVPELPHFISMLVGSVAGNFFDAQTADTSDGQGRAIARVRFGAIAGPGAIEISVPEFGLADTVDFTITPGRPNSVRALPED